MFLYLGLEGERGFKVSQELQELLRSGFIEREDARPARRVIAKIQSANKKGETSVGLTDEEAKAVMDAALDYGEFKTVAPFDEPFSFASGGKPMASFPDRQSNYESYPTEEWVT